MKIFIEPINLFAVKISKNGSMMKKLKIILSVTIILTFTACNFVSIQGDGRISEVEKEVSSFNQIEASGAYNIYVEFGNESKIKVIADKNLHKFILAKIEDETLILSTKKSIKPTQDIEVFITTPSLVRVELSGANDMEVHKLQADVFKAEISGAGTILLDGNVNVLDVEISGAGDLKAETLFSKIAKIEVSGAGNGILNVEDELYAEVSGAADLVYIGSPKKIKKSLSGAGSIRNRK